MNKDGKISKRLIAFMFYVNIFLVTFYGAITVNEIYKIFVYKNFDFIILLYIFVVICNGISIGTKLKLDKLNNSKVCFYFRVREHEYVYTETNMTYNELETHREEYKRLVTVAIENICNEFKCDVIDIMPISEEEFKANVKSIKGTKF